MTDEITPEELTAMESDLAYWQELADLVPGWRVFGWTYKNTASYDTGTDSLVLKGHQRDDLIAALTKSNG